MAERKTYTLAVVLGVMAGAVMAGASLVTWASLTFDAGSGSQTQSVNGSQAGGSSELYLGVGLAVVSALLWTGMEPRRAGAVMAIVSIAAGSVAGWFVIRPEVSLGLPATGVHVDVGAGAIAALAASIVGLVAAIIAIARSLLDRAPEGEPAAGEPAADLG